MVTKKRDSKRSKPRGKNNMLRSERIGYCPEEGFDYKAVGLLKKYISETGKIDSAKRNGLTAKCQRSLTNAIKRARHMALLPFSSNHNYDTSLLSFDKNKSKDNNEDENFSIDEVKSESNASDDMKDEVNEQKEINQNDSQEESTNSDKVETEEDLEKSEWK